MKIICGIVVVVVVSACIASCVESAVVGLPDAVARNGIAGHPGSKFGITRKFAKYANEVVIDVLKDVAPIIEISDVRLNSAGNNLRFTNLKITNFEAPTNSSLKFQSPNKITWHLFNMTIGINGKFETKFSGMAADGKFNGSAVDLDVSVGLEVTNGLYGRLKLKSTECSAKMKNLDLHVYDAGIFDQLFKALKFVFINFIKTNLEQRLCSEYDSLINDYLDRKIEHIPTNVSLNSFFPNTAKMDNELMHNLHNALDELVLDYSLLADPTVSSKALNLHSRSEVSFGGHGNTPFFPAQIDDNCDFNMICLSISDYVVNSFMWHAYSKGSLDFRVDKLKAKGVGSLLDEQQQCEETNAEFCMNEMVKNAEAVFPHADFELRIKPLESPAVIIDTDKVTIISKNFANLLANDAASGDGKVSLLEVEFKVEARFSPTLKDDSIIYANFSMDKLKLKLLKASKLVTVDDRTLSDFAFSLKRIIESSLNKFLHNGIRIPKIRELQFKNAKISLLPRRVKIQTDVQVDAEYLKQFIGDAITKLNEH